MRFLGNIEAKADSKGRVFLPAGFRKVLQASGEDQIVMRKDVFQDCLVLYPESVWNEQVDMLRSKLNRWNKQHQQIYRQFVSDVELVNLDASGRMLIPRRYQQLVGITQEVRFLGVGDTIEIWAGGKDSKPFMDAEDFGKALEELMEEPLSTQPPSTQPLSRPSDTLSP
jgi:MraZ protein